MNNEALTEFDQVLICLSDFYRTNRLVNIKKVRPLLERVLELVTNDSANIDLYKLRFLQLVDDLVVIKSHYETTRNIHVVDFCMRSLKWPEIEVRLKLIYGKVVNPDTRMKVEALIKNVFDFDWQGGEFDFLVQENMWE